MNVSSFTLSPECFGGRDLEFLLKFRNGQMALSLGVSLPQLFGCCDPVGTQLCFLLRPVFLLLLLCYPLWLSSSTPSPSLTP